MRSTFAVATLVTAVAVQAADHVVQVGANNQLIFSPNTVTAANGDTISFQFQGKNHSVTQSSFAAPCTELASASAVNSGFMFVPPGSTSLPQFQINVTDASTPVWFFCAQTNPISHCESGMVFAINPTADKTFQAFQQAAMALNTTAGSSSAPAGATGTGAGGATGAPATGAPGSVSVTVAPGAGSTGSPAGTASSANSTTTHSGAMSMRSVEFGGFMTGVVTAAAVIFSFAL